VSVKRMASGPAERTRGFTIIEVLKTSVHDSADPDDKQAATD
jgi:hypothetical protein